MMQTLKLSSAGKGFMHPRMINISVFTDANLNWKHHTNKISTKLIKGIGILSKFQHFVNKDILLSAYYAIFNSHLADILLV